MEGLDMKIIQDRNASIFAFLNFSRKTSENTIIWEKVLACVESSKALHGFHFFQTDPICWGKYLKKLNGYCELRKPKPNRTDFAGRFSFGFGSIVGLHFLLD